MKPFWSRRSFCGEVLIILLVTLFTAMYGVSDAKDGDTESVTFEQAVASAPSGAQERLVEWTIESAKHYADPFNEVDSYKVRRRLSPSLARADASGVGATL